MIIDDSWRQGHYESESAKQDVYVKRFSEFKDAEAIVDRNFDDVYACSGAIMLGESKRVPSITIQEINRIICSEAELPGEEPGFTEVLFVPDITFERLILFLNYLKYPRSKPIVVTKSIREEAKTLLRWVAQLQPFGLIRVHPVLIGLRFFEPLPEDKADSIFERVMEFNSKYFSVETDLPTCRRTLIKGKRFVLGAC